MGCNFLNRHCQSSPYAAPNSNPDALNFRIITEQRIGKYLVLLVHYPDCTNYEGKKLMVYEGFNSAQELIKHNLGKLDPHFSTGSGSPIARFKPTDASLELIERMIK